MLKCISSDRYTMRTRLMLNRQTTLKPCLKVFDSVMKYCKRCKVVSRRHFPKGDSQVRDSFHSGNFPNVRFPKRKLSKGQVRPSEAPQDAMGGRALRLGGRVPRLEQYEGRALRLGQTWEVVASEISYMGSCHLRK